VREEAFRSRGSDLTLPSPPPSCSNNAKYLAVSADRASLGDVEADCACGTIHPALQGPPQLYSFRDISLGENEGSDY
jgi:hypothetical protein